VVLGDEEAIDRSINQASDPSTNRSIGCAAIACRNHRHHTHMHAHHGATHPCHRRRWRGGVGSGGTCHRQSPFGRTCRRRPTCAARTRSRSVGDDDNDGALGGGGIGGGGDVLVVVMVLVLVCIYRRALGAHSDSRIVSLSRSLSIQPTIRSTRALDALLAIKHMRSYPLKETTLGRFTWLLAQSL
jgi:hypothetical protein